jgi:hypothetical protein
MEGSPIIAGILLVCVVLALRWGAALLKRRLGQRDMGVIGFIAVVALSLAIMWPVSHFVSNDSYYWFIAIGACSGISVLVSQVLFGKTRHAPEKLS